MPIRETESDRGARRSRYLVARTAEGLSDARRAAGLSLREVARRLGEDHRRLARAERGDAHVLTIELAARFAAVVGRELNASRHPDGDPVRDKAHLAVIGRFRDRVGSAVTMRTEVPIPISGDRRSADVVLGAEGFEAIVEAETRLGDVQAFQRSIAAKQRDLGVGRAILLLADTRHNRAVVRNVPGLAERFPIGTRACLAALRQGRDPGGDCLVTL